MCVFEDSLEKLIADAGLCKKTTYSTGEVAKILGISTNMVIMLCDLWTPVHLDGLECYRVGTHRKIPHHSIVEWLNKNSIYNETGEIK